MTVRELRNIYNLNYLTIYESMKTAKEQGLKDQLYVYREFEEKMHRITKATFDKEGIINRGSASKFNKTQLQKAVFLQKEFLNNALTSESGRNAILNNVYLSFRASNPNSTRITPEKFLQLIDILKSDSLSMLFDVKNISSDIILNMVRNNSSAQVSEVLKEVAELPNINELSRFEVSKEIYDRMRKL